MPGGIKARERSTLATVSDIAPGHVSAWIELKLDQCRRLDVLGFDVLDAGDVEKMVFVIIGDVAFHLGRIHAAIRLHDIDRGDAQTRKNIPGHFDDRHQRSQHERDRR